VSRYRCIVAEKATYPVRLLCRALDVSASGFYAWWRRGPSDRERQDHTLLGWIRAIHGRSLGTYGAPRIHAELEYGHGVHVGRKRVERLMRADGLSGRHLRRRRGLTKQDRMAVPAPDLLGREFSPASAAIPGARMVGDITYLATGEGWLYLADALDLATRSVLGYAMADHMRADLVVDALDMAAGRVQLPAGAIFHSDRGSQYTSLAFARACDRLGVSRSMGRTGSCFDNAVAESFWGTLKRELGRGWWPTRADARRAVFHYISIFYNRQRRHSALGYLTPQEAIDRYSRRQTLVA
jgi:transposase InsO family protein